jgi:hypothetical protein
MTTPAYVERRVEVVRGHNRMLRELLYAVAGLLVGALGTIAYLSRELGATQQQLANNATAIANGVTATAAASVIQNNLLNMVQAQATQLATLSAQVSMLLAAKVKP